MIKFEPTVVVVNDYSHTFSNVLIDGCSIISSIFDSDSIIAIASKQKPFLIVIVNSKSSTEITLQLKNNWETKDIPIVATQSSLSVNEITSEIRVNLLLRTNITGFRKY